MSSRRSAGGLASSTPWAAGPPDLEFDVIVRRTTAAPRFGPAAPGPVEDVLDGWAGTLGVVSHERCILGRIVATRSPCSATVRSATYPAVWASTVARAAWRVVLQPHHPTSWRAGAAEGRGPQSDGADRGGRLIVAETAGRPARRRRFP